MPTMMVVPSGIGCSVGGFAGDAIPAARLLAAASGCLITHPNVMNGASIYWNDRRIQYVEGYGLDQFAAGEIALRPVRKQKIGLLMDSGIESDLRLRHFQVADACRASLGIDIGPTIFTEEPLEIQITSGNSGASWGVLRSPETLIRAGESLQSQGATAIAVVTRFPDSIDSKSFSAYREGKGVDAIAGAEAIISHLLVRHLGIPCAHSPALSPLSIASNLDPRAAGEELGYTFLSCVLVGLSRAPDLVSTIREPCVASGLNLNMLQAEQLGAVVVPDGSLGGSAILSCLERGVPIIAVDNPSTLKVDINNFSPKVISSINSSFVIKKVSSYVEAAGLLILMREGISIESLERPISQIK